ncbi:helix-turn-helix domain-containing protein [Ferruginibacter sp.]
MKAESVLQIFKDIKIILQKQNAVLLSHKIILQKQNALLLSQKNFLTVEELAVYAGITKSWIYKLTSAGLLKCSKPTGKKLYFKRTEIDDWLLSNPSLEKTSITEILEKRKSKR